MIQKISCEQAAALMASAGLFAVFDVRERGEYNDCQIPNTTSLPRSQIEFRVGELVRNRAIPIALDDKGAPQLMNGSNPLTPEAASELVLKPVFSPPEK